MLGPTIRKELQLLRRDPRVIVRLLVLPVAFIALFGMAFKGGENKLQRRPLGAWCDPAGARCKPVLAALDGSGQFAVKMAASADGCAARSPPAISTSGSSSPRTSIRPRGTRPSS
jgi:hypothetical protein